MRLQRVTARALIAAPRERVWVRLHRDRAARPWLVDPILRWGADSSAAAGHVRALGWPAEEQVVACVPPDRYGYRLVCGPLFRTYTGQILLGEYHRAATEVTWMIEFQAALPGTGWLAYAALDRLIDTSLLRLKRELETVHLP